MSIFNWRMKKVKWFTDSRISIFLIVVSCMNAEVEKDDTGKDIIIGRKNLWYHQESRFFVDICLHINLVIDGTLAVPQKYIHKATWVFPDMSMKVKQQFFVLVELQKQTKKHNKHNEQYPDDDEDELKTW